MINRIELYKAIEAGEQTPETSRFWAHIMHMGGENLYALMPGNLYNYLQAVIHTKRIRPCIESETILFQVCNVLDRACISFASTKELMRKIERHNAVEITQALRNLNVRVAA